VTIRQIASTQASGTPFPDAAVTGPRGLNTIGMQTKAISYNGSPRESAPGPSEKKAISVRSPRAGGGSIG
jgi:hypothetical protein